MPLARAEPSLVTDRVFQSIHEAIMSGELPVGTQLKIRDLAEQVGTSVMPVREAIRRLEENGLVRSTPHRGAVVKGLTIDELEQVYDVRLLLETEAARLGSTLIKPKDRVQMMRACEKLARAVTEGRLIDALNLDEAMLGVLYTASGNAVLTESIRGLWQRCRPYKIRGANRASERHDETLWSFQPQLAAAVDRQDAHAAAEITRNSLLSARARIRATIEDSQDTVIA